MCSERLVREVGMIVWTILGTSYHIERLVGRPIGVDVDFPATPRFPATKISKALVQVHL
jgi:hypothetical protein